MALILVALDGWRLTVAYQSRDSGRLISSEMAETIDELRGNSRYRPMARVRDSATGNLDALNALGDSNGIGRWMPHILVDF
ncbi:hypothetical protein [Rhodopirellula sp. SWK7]|uniref:hypothetical protein n=1 Tax=Rhodopirellula sp. SWK7 TaxID=595460 RepID=UPI001F22ADE5|nr:hypothetical protein [Rhodopirellula sp. SWK7]